MSGHIRSTLEMGAVKIGRDVLGGTGVSSGTIFAGTTLAGVTIGDHSLAAVVRVVDRYFPT